MAGGNRNSSPVYSRQSLGRLNTCANGGGESRIQPQVIKKPAPLGTGYLFHPLIKGQDQIASVDRCL
jgi:hypothetical protein